MRYIEWSELQKQKVEWWLTEAEGGDRNGESLFNGYRISVWDDKQVQEMDNGDDCTTM